MGMDCIPLNPWAKGFHANFVGWQFIAEALHLLGADTSRMSGSNDGDVIDRETAQDWAARLRWGVVSGRLRITPVTDSFTGRERDSVSLTTGVPSQQSDDAAWLRSVADFFERSGGFQQY